MEPIQSVIFGFGFQARSGKDEAANWIKLNRGKSPLVFEGYDIGIYGFGQELKREVNECALKSGGMQAMFSDGLRMEGCGFLQENGNIIALPDWVQYDPNPDMTDPLCPMGKQRTLLQWWGTEYRRNINPDYWVNKLAARLAKEKPEIALIIDTRFMNEVKFIQEYGNVIRVKRTGLVAPQTPHISEQALINFIGWDAVIENDSTLEVFHERVLFTFDSLMSAQQ